MRKNIHNILLEELSRKQKEELERLYNVWKETLPDLPADLAEKVYVKHREIYNRVKKDHPAVYRFLLKYNGKNNKPKYTIDDLKNINQPKVRIDHLIDFLEDFIREQIAPKKDETVDEKKNDIEKLNSVFSDEGENLTMEKLEESENLWRNGPYLVIDNNNLKVVEVMNSTHAKWLGYYYQFVNAVSATQLDITTLAWCVTHRGNGIVQYRINEYGEKVDNRRLYNHGANQYNGYRNRNFKPATFYFIMDESRPKTDDYHFGALLVCDDNTYMIANQFQNNGGERFVSWEQLLQIYPGLNGSKEVLKYRDDDVDFENAEPIEINIVERMNERLDSPYFYGRQTPELQKEYIDNGNMLTSAICWRATDTDVKKTYINLTQEGNLFARFSTFDLINEIMKKTDEKNYLNRKITQLGQPMGIAYLVKNLLRSSFAIKIGENINNPNHSILKHKDRDVYGIFDFDKEVANWVNHDNITYSPEYKKKPEVYVHTQGQNKTRYFVNRFYKTNEDDEEDDRTFYALKKSTDSSNKFYIISKKGMDAIKDNYDFVLDSKEFRTQPTFDSDIKENYYDNNL